MANGRSAGRAKRDNGRDPGGFIALPVSVLDCPGHRALSHTARALLIEVARQFHGDDNGRMLLSRAYLAGRGWKSSDVIDRAKGQLIEGGFIIETVKGHRPNKASWYAVTSSNWGAGVVIACVAGLCEAGRVCPPRDGRPHRGQPQNQL